ncbi:MAG: hypothetical protein HRU13_12520 [Phycisphaerales bacterium]|nr:hypothetical protein [Phycisphaerales bacterium]
MVIASNGFTKEADAFIELAACERQHMRLVDGEALVHMVRRE